jgi:hypothetical protein
MMQDVTCIIYHLENNNGQEEGVKENVSETWISQSVQPPVNIDKQLSFTLV